MQLPQPDLSRFHEDTIREGFRELEAKLDRLALKIADDQPTHAGLARSIHYDAICAVQAGRALLKHGEKHEALTLLSLGDSSADMLQAIADGELPDDTPARLKAAGYCQTIGESHHVH